MTTAKKLIPFVLIATVQGCGSYVPPGTIGRARVYAPPTVTGIAPTRGPSNETVGVTVTGNFPHDMLPYTVSLKDHATVAATAPAVWQDSYTLLVNLPPAAPGFYHLVVTSTVSKESSRPGGKDIYEAYW